MSKIRSQDAAVFLLLIAVGAFGRLWQPEWNVSPVVGSALLGGWYFGRSALAVMVPLLAMFLSDIALPGHTHLGVMLVVYGAMVLPALLGPALRTGRGMAWLTKFTASAVAPATAFYLLTNLAVWAFQSNYPKTLEGLGACYVAALPFYRWMLAGDLFYATALFGTVALVGLAQRQVAPACVEKAR